MQRLHERDLTGHLLSTEPERWTHVKLPMVAEQDEEIVFPVSGRVIQRKRGDLLHPSRFSKQWCEAEKKAIGSYTWSGQYQQSPAPADGGIIQRTWCKKFWRKETFPSKFDTVLQSWDCTFKDTKNSDYVAGHVWASAGSSCYLLDRVHARLDFPATVAAIRGFSAKWPSAFHILVEDKANGPAVISSLQRDVSGLIAVNPEGGKESRLRAVSALFEAGNIVFPDPLMPGYSWVNDVIHELCTFPNAAHDDDCDAASQALLRLKLNNYQYGVIEMYGREQEAQRSGHDINQAIRISKDANKPDEGKPRCIICGSLRMVSSGIHWKCSECWALIPRTAPNRAEVIQ